MNNLNKLSFINLSALFVLSTLTVLPGKANAGPDPFIGEIMWVGYNFCPRNFTEANGQLLPISQNTALFSLYGTMYGGDGRTNFALPDLRGRSQVHTGQGPGLSNVRQGDRGGAENVALTVNEIPSHTHTATLRGTSEAGNVDTPADAVLAYKNRSKIYNDSLLTNSNMDASSVTVANTGGSRSHQNRSPYLGMRACVALQGIFPSRN